MENTAISSVIDAMYNLEHKIKGSGFEFLTETIENHRENLLFIENYILHNERKDLFEYWERLPSLLREVLDANYSDKTTLDEIHNVQQKVEKLGYTFDYDFSCAAFGLRPISVALNELEGHED